MSSKIGESQFSTYNFTGLKRKKPPLRGLSRSLGSDRRVYTQRKTKLTDDELIGAWIRPKQTIENTAR